MPNVSMVKLLSREDVSNPALKLVRDNGGFPLRCDKILSVVVSLYTPTNIVGNCLPIGRDHR